MAALSWISIVLFTLLSMEYAMADSRVITARGDVNVPKEDLPLPYKADSVTGAVIMMDASLVTEYEGKKDQDKIIVDILGQGPIPWSISRFDDGDLSPRLQPRRPYAQPNLGIPGKGRGGFSTSDPHDFSAQAWRPSLTKGVLLASVAKNGQEWKDGTPRFYGTVACVFNSEGYGYSMDDGLFGKDDPNIDVTVGKAGKMGEANIDVAIAWFPYHQGWTAGYINQPSGGQEPAWQIFQSHSAHLPSDGSKVVKWSKKGASLKLPGVNPSTDGMIFLTSTDPGDGNNDVNTISVYTRTKRSEWRVQQREDSSYNISKLADPSQGMFAFVYIPWTAGGLIGANIDGKSGNTLIGRGQFLLSRIKAGQYEIILGRYPTNQKSQRDGMLLLQVIGRDDTNHKYTKSAFLSYEYTSQGTLMVEARHLVIDGNGKESFPLTDADFSFAWVDFRNPLTPTPELFSGTFVTSTSASKGGFWTGFGTAVLLMALCAFVGYGVMMYMRTRQYDSPFWNSSRRQGDSAELGSDLLRSEFTFAD